MCGLVVVIKHIYSRVHISCTRRSKARQTRNLAISAPTNFHKSAMNLPGASMEDLTAEHEIYVHTKKGVELQVHNGLEGYRALGLL